MEPTPTPSIERLKDLAYKNEGLPVTAVDLAWAANQIEELTKQRNRLWLLLDNIGQDCSEAIPHGPIIHNLRREQALGNL